MSEENTMAGAVLSDIFAVSSSMAPAPEEESKITGHVTLNNFWEKVGDGNAYKPLNEVVYSLSCGERLGFQASGDFENNGAFDYGGMRREQLFATYKVGDISSPLSITGGYLGEHRKFEGLSANSAGQPFVGFEQTLFAKRIDNPDLFGVILNKDFSLGDQWKLAAKGSAFGVFEQNDNPANLPEDRANSTTPSWHAKAKFSHDKLSFGAEGGRTENGVIGEEPETYIGAFAQHNTPLTDTLNWKNTAETIYFDNLDNKGDVTGYFNTASSNLEWQPSNLKDVTLWGHVGSNFGSALEEDELFAGVGGRWDMYKKDDLTVSAFAAADVEKELGGDKNCEIGRQVGMRVSYGF